MRLFLAEGELWGWNGTRLSKAWMAGEHAIVGCDPPKQGHLPRWEAACPPAATLNALSDSNKGALSAILQGDIGKEPRYEA